MKEKTICCVICPNGCMMKVRAEEDGKLNIAGAKCRRGTEYAAEEFIMPKRMLTTVVRAEEYCTPVIPVRSAKLIPRELLLPCVEVLREATAQPPYYVGKVIVKNILGCGVDIVIANS